MTDIPTLHLAQKALADAAAADAKADAADSKASAKIGSVFGRTTVDIVAASGDYGSNQITNQSGVAGATVSDALGTLNGQVWVPGMMTRYNGLAQNLNGTNVIVDWSGSNVTLGSHVTFDPAFPTRIGVSTTGYYALGFNLKGTSAATQRANITSQFRLNGATLIGTECAEGYIRISSGHTESSQSMSPFLYQLTAGWYVEVVCNREAAAGNWDIAVEACNITLEYKGS